MDSNFKLFVAGLSGKIPNISVDIMFALQDATQQQPLCEKLNANSVTVIDEELYSFTSQVASVDVKENKGPGVTIDSKMDVVKISFDVADIDVVLPFLQQCLSENNLELDLHEIYQVRHVAYSLDGLAPDRQAYLLRAMKLIAAIQNDPNPALKLEYNQILQFVYELPVVARRSFAYKVAALFQAKGLRQCAAGVTALFALQDGATELQEIYKLDLFEVLCLPGAVVNTNISRVDAKIFEDDKTLYLGFEDKDYEAHLFEALSKSRKFSVADKEYSFDITKGLTANDPKVPALLISFARDTQFAVLDYIFMQLDRNCFLLNHKDNYNLRQIFGFTRPDHYVKFATGVIGMLASKGDDQYSYEQNWLIRMSYELPDKLRPQFVLDVAKILSDKGLIRCALSLTVLHRDDTRCPELAAFVAEQEAKLEVTAGAKIIRFTAKQAAVAPIEQTTEARQFHKAKRLEFRFI